MTNPTAIRLASEARLADPARGLTVGAALADPRVQVGTHVVELRGRDRWHQVVVRGHRFETRALVDGSWSDLRSYTLDALDITCPCRLVPLADADRDPATRGPL